MKIETTDQTPKFNLLDPDGRRSQAHSEAITEVLLTDGNWYKIEPGSFKFYKTAGDRGVPFVQFRTPTFNGSPDQKGIVASRIIEVFPASVVGIAYRPESD